MPQSLSNLIMHLKPYWLTDAQAVVPLVLGEGPGIDIIGSTIGLGGDTILLYHTGGNPVTEYALTLAGLVAALAAATTGEWVRINAPCTITGDITIPAGVELRADSQAQITIAGKVTTNNGSKLTNISIANTANNANALYGVVGPVTGSAHVIGCDISAIQSGSGNAYAVGAINGLSISDGAIYVDDCSLYGSSVGGSGYAGRSTRGYLYVTGNTHGIYGSTLRFAVT